MLIAYPGRRFALPWADMFLAFQADLRINDSLLTR